MKHIYSLIFALMLSTLGLAQVTIAPGSLSTTLSETGDHLYNLTITNTGASAVNVWWKVKKGANFPSQWSTQTCDLFLCYPFNTDDCPPSKGQSIAPNTTITYTMHFYPNGTIGTSSLSFELYSDKAFKTLVAQTDPSAVVIADKLLSTKNVSSSDIKIFPNPAEDFFTVKNDAAVAKVGIFNIVGKEIDTYKHVSGNSYNVSNFTRGLYIVRLIDNRGKTLKSIRLNKR
jgi:hypothetical protein